MQSYDGFWLIPRNFVFFARSCCDTGGCFVTDPGERWHSCRIPPCYIRKFFRSFRKNFRSTQELCLGCFFYAYLCIVKAVAARKTGPLTARQTNLRNRIGGTPDLSKNFSDRRHLRRYGCPERLKCLICLTSFLEKQTSGDSEREVYC